MDIIAHLKKQKVKFEHMTHEEKFTTQEVAAAQHVPGAEMMKAVLVDVDGEKVLAVLSANYNINFKELAKALSAKKVKLAFEDDLQQVFPDVEVGAEPPFGSLYGVKTVVDEQLAAESEVVFQSGTHKDTVKMSWDDYRKIEKPEVVPFGEHI
jgi:Ala-tRNA(Pro) deacylase